MSEHPAASSRPIIRHRRTKPGAPASVTPKAGWRQLGLPDRSAAELMTLSPFARLARAHAATVAGDTSIAVSLAGSLFFSADPKAARTKVLAYLLLTIAPFAVVGPLIGPGIDRMPGGRRLMVIVGAFARAAVCLFMIRDLNSPLLFPEAFMLLVLGKGYHVAKSALVPTVVKGDNDLVEANSKLQLISGVVGVCASIPAVILLQIGAQWTVGLAVLEFAVAGVLGLRIPRTTVAIDAIEAEEIHELRSGGILLGASAIGLVRGIVGFLTFMLAFALRVEKAPTYWYGIMLAGSTAGGLLGAALAPKLRKSFKEETVLTASVAAICLAAIVAVMSGGRSAAAGLALAIGAASSAGKMAFDAIVQRDAPEANRGRAFARFETRFQLAWVLGAVIPVIHELPLSFGFVVIAGVAGFAVVSYYSGTRTMHRTGKVPEHLTNPRLKVTYEKQKAALRARVKERASRATNRGPRSR